MFRKAKIIVAALGLIGSITVAAAPAQAWGYAAYTMFYDETWTYTVGYHIQCINDPWVELYGGDVSNYSTTQVGFWDACPDYPGPY